MSIQQDFQSEDDYQFMTEAFGECEAIFLGLNQQTAYNSCVERHSRQTKFVKYIKMRLPWNTWEHPKFALSINA
jgi:hypothetical protein